MAGIDRDYWLDFAKDGVSNSIQNREKAAKDLDSFLTWIWGIYTSVFAVASLFNFVSSDVWQLIWVVQPILIIMIARYTCARVSMPSTNDDDKISADPNDVASIIDSFKLIVQDKKKKLATAKWLTILLIVSLSLALMGYNYCDPNKELKQNLQELKLEKDISDQLIVPVSVQEKKNEFIKSLNDYYDYQFENMVKKRKFKCLQSGDSKCLDSLKLLVK